MSTEDMAGRERPTTHAQLSIKVAPTKIDRPKVSFANIEGRIETDVERTRRRSIVFFVVGAVTAVLGTVVGIVTSFETSKPGVGFTLAIITAFFIVAVGSAIGLLLSLPDKRQRQAKIKDLVDALGETGSHGNDHQSRPEGRVSGSANG